MTVTSHILVDRFRSSSAGQQAGLVAVAALALGGLLWVLWYAMLRIDYQPLFTDLQTAEAATIVAELDRRKVPYRLENGGTEIRVPADLVDATRLNVTSEDLPLKGMVGFELFNKSDMGLTDFAQKINYQRALQGELARTIMSLDRVAAARVHLALGEDRLFRDDRVPPKASITIRMQNNGPVVRTTVEGVQRLVAAAVPRLDAGDVVVLDEGGRVLSADLAPATRESSEAPQVQEKHAVEQFYAARVRQALEGAFPGGKALVSVRATPDSAAGMQENLDTDATKRAFRLLITLTPATLLGRSEQDEMRGAAAAAVGLDPARGDLILFGDAPPIDLPADRNPVAAPDVPPLSLSTRPAVEKRQGTAEFIAIGLGLATLAAVGLWLILRRRSTRLDEAGRLAFAERLKTLLEGDGDAAARS